MAWSSWVRRTVSRNGTNTETPDPITQSTLKVNGKPEEEDDLGITDQLIDYIQSFTLDTFKNFPLRDNEAANTSYDDGTARSSSANVRHDLSEWQERHAVLVLSKVKELSQLRFKLCPRYLKEQQFWKIYFKLVKNHVIDYELRAIKCAKIKRMTMDNGKARETVTAYEVEMAETKQAMHLAPTTP